MPSTFVDIILFRYELENEFVLIATLSSFNLFVPFATKKFYNYRNLGQRNYP